MKHSKTCYFGTSEKKRREKSLLLVHKRERNRIMYAAPLFKQHGSYWTVFRLKKLSFPSTFVFIYTSSLCVRKKRVDDLGKYPKQVLKGKSKKKWFSPHYIEPQPMRVSPFNWGARRTREIEREGDTNTLGCCCCWCGLLFLGPLQRDRRN